MIIENALVIDNFKIAKDTFLMKLQPSFLKEIRPGQFINIKIDKHYLRRPISVASIEEDHLVIIYKLVGQGTKDLSQVKKGQRLEVMGPLGRFFSIHEDLDQVLIVGGGVGIPPLYEVAKNYQKLDKRLVVVLGFRSKEEVFFEEEFKKLTKECYIATDDGSYGFKGNVLDLIDSLKLDIDLIYSVGPKPMLRALQERYDKGYISLEERMACGVGLCMGCVCKDKNIADKTYRVCKEGPVFEIGKVEI
ncbi:MAG: dihydroorotate dehydrogenase electron transfer subunit [Tissierellia bacterium]|nr:dihydroorotate dehydrogenase electron transfer subunit [Tissierellia bacterium]